MHETWTTRRGSYGVLGAILALCVMLLAMGAAAMGLNAVVVPLVVLDVLLVCAIAAVLGGFASGTLLVLGRWFPRLARWGIGFDQWLDEAP